MREENLTSIAYFFLTIWPFRNAFLDIDNGSISIDSGTSGAVPTVAAIITLVNDARISAGKKPVGM